MAKRTKCGGLLYNEEHFGEVDGVLTFANLESILGTPFVAHCGGQKFDSEVFQEYVMKDMYGNDVYVIGVAGDMPPTMPPIRANCSLLFDSEVVRINPDGGIDFMY